MDMSAPSKPELQYPFAAQPGPGELMPVAPGVFWIRMPLPGRLNHINLWVIEDGDGWALVDTGLRTEETVALWRDLFANALRGKPLRRIFVTHMHPDHVGMAGWLARKERATLWMSRLEYLTCRVMASDSGREAPPEALEFYRQAGWSETALDAYRARFGRFGSAIHALPDCFHRLDDGMEVPIGGRTWRVVMGNGHSPEHACLHCPELDLFISGDQVLPRISSNVSLHPTEPDSNPMADWLDSVAKLRREVPDSVLVLPAHNECFRGLHARLDYLGDSQRHVLDNLSRVLSEPRRAVDVFEVLFGRPIDESQISLFGMATGESLACLQYLIGRGEAVKELRDGVAWYSACAR